MNTSVSIVRNIRKHGLYKDYVNILGFVFLSSIKFRDSSKENLISMIKCSDHGIRLKK